MQNYLHPNGWNYTQLDIEEAAKKYGMSVDDYLKKEKFEIEKPGKTNGSTDAGLLAVEPSNMESKSGPGFSASPKVKHATVDQMKDGVSWLQAEGDFVKNMNEHYKDSGIIFKDAVGGTDAFTMYDTVNDETSEPVRVPNLFGQSYHEGYGVKSWDNVNSKVKQFFDREKVDNKKFTKRKESAENVIAEKLEDEGYLTNLLGEDFNFEYAEKLERGGKGEDYQTILKALKKEVGVDGGFFGVNTSGMNEQAVEEMVTNAVTKKFEKDRANKSHELEVKLASTIEEEKTTETLIDKTNKQSKINGLSKKERALYSGIEKLKTFDPGSSDYIKQKNINKKLKDDYDGWYSNSEWLVDSHTGISVNPLSPDAEKAVPITKEDLDKTKKKIELTYGENLKDAFEINGRKKWLSDKQGEETFDITVNDPQARSVFETLGYETKSDNKNGYEFEVKLKDLAKYYDATVKSDGFTFLSGAKGSSIVGYVDAENPDYDSSKPEGPSNRKTIPKKSQSLGSKFQGLLGIADKPSFTSPQGYFGLTEKNNEQEFTVGEQRFFDQDEYAEDDKSKGFKRMLKDYRDDRFTLIKEGKVLTKMHMLNIDPASEEDIPVTRGLELAAEGFKGIFGGSQADVDLGTSGREQLDILEGIANKGDIKLTTTQEEAVKRTGTYRVYEGVAGFVPAIAEFFLVDLAIKKGTGIIPGATKLVSKLSKGNTLQKGLYHTGGLIKEEVKMKAVFDEHYHMGGGAGFYAVGNLMPNFKSKYNLLNTFMNANKSGVGGSLSVQAAANLEALVRDVKGKESYQTWVKENYGDLKLTSEDMLVDYFIFTSIGAKGWAKGAKLQAFKTTSRLEKLQEETANKIINNDALIKSSVASTSGKSKAESENEKLIDLHSGVTQRLNGIYNMNNWMDPEKATKLMDAKIGKNLRNVFGPDFKLEIVSERKDKNGDRKFEFNDSSAEYIEKEGKIIVDANRAEIGTLPHEVFHHVANTKFKDKNSGPEHLNIFKSKIESAFKGVKFEDVAVKENGGAPNEKLTGEKRSMNIEELIMNEHGKQAGFDDIKANEFLAYTAQVLANPTYYSKLTANNTWKKIKMDVNKFSNRHAGMSVFKTGTKQDLIDFMANFSRSVSTGTLTRKQVSMFSKIKEGKIFAEGIEADSRTEQRKNTESSEKEMKTAMPTKSVELSSKTQKIYDIQVKGKEGRQLDRAIERMIVPGTGKGSVAGENFDNIIYDLIKNMYPDVSKNPDQRYTLALDMVYDLNRSEGSKNRGIQGIIKEYSARKEFFEPKGDFVVFDSEGNKKLSKTQIEALESKYDAKSGSQEFIDQAKKEGYKGKQNLTKTVREGLIKRIHEIKNRAFDQESDFAELGYTESIQEMGQVGRELVDMQTPTFEFKSREDKAREAKGQSKVNVKDYVPARDLVPVRKVTTEILRAEKDLIGLRPKVISKAAKKLQPIVEKQFGRVKETKDKDGNITYEKVAKKDYYDIQKELFESKEKELYKIALPENRDRNTSEANMIAKTAFDRLYKESGEFSYADLNKGTPKQLLTESQKREGRKKFTKEPYRKGILTEIIFEGDRKDVHHSRANILMPYITSRLAEKVMIDQLNNPRYAAMLKEMNPGVYEGLQLEGVIKSIQENLRGMSDKALASNKAKLAGLPNELVKKINEGTGVKAAMNEIIAQNPELKKYKDTIFKEMDLYIKEADTVDKQMMKVGESTRLTQELGPKLKPTIFSGWKGKKGEIGVHDAIMEWAGNNGIPKDLLNINTAGSKRMADPEFSKRFAEEFIPEFFNTFDSRLLSTLQAPIGKTMGEGVQRFGYRKLVKYVKDGINKTRNLIFNAEMREGIFEGIEGKKDKLGFDVNYVRVNNNSTVKNMVADILSQKSFNLTSPEGKTQLANYVKKKLSPDKTIDGFNKMVDANEGMLKYTSEKIFDYLNNAKTVKQKADAINNISYMLQFQTNLGSGLFRGLATHTAITTNIAKKYHSEHEFQLANFTGNLMMSALKNTGNKKKFTEQLKPLTKAYKQSIIEKTLQERIDKDGNTANRMSKEGVDLDQLAKGEFLLERIIMESTLDLKTGKTFDQVIDNIIEGGGAYKSLQRATNNLIKQSKNNNLPSKNVTTTEMLRNMRLRDKALEQARKKGKKARGMSTFDFDETVGVSNNFVIAKKGGKTKKIASNEWPFVGDKLINEGWKMDFSDFNKVTDGKPGPLMQKMKNQIKKFGPDNVFILTARAAESQKAIHEYLKSEGIKIPLKNITGLGNSTGEAKAMWMLEKFAEGYNDMYFVDDAMPNVKAVKDVLDQLDIKSKVRQALATKDYSLEMNNMIESTFGVESKKRFSTAEGKVRGKDKKRRKFFMVDSAADMELLMEPLYGKGKKGMQNKKWFEDNFYKPWERGTNDLNTARQTILNDYMSLRKNNKDIVKSLSKQVEGTNFTTDQAARVYIWNKAGFEVPGLTKTSKAKLLEHVNNNPKLQAYAEHVARLTKIETGLKQPNNTWWAETIATEVSETGRTVGRDKYIGDWIQRKNEVFSEENMAKMESELGPKWRESVENMFYRMETGTTKPKNLGRIGNGIMNYLNGSVGAIMNLNTRSATLQLISSVNFINHAENNPLKAAKAFANQPQYWKDFMTIMNSDMLKQRRDGLKINVTEAELAAAVDGSGNKAKKALAWILKQGYLPTKIADSFAISSGGATYYRNRAKMYQKEGLSLKEAEAKAFVDFQAIAEKTQQSSRADLLSQQQTSFEGRLLLPFSNTPMQMNRIMMKEMLDLSKGRYKGSFGENSITNKMSKIAYYGVVQSAIFAGLQTGLFALMANSDDEEQIATKKARAINTMADSFLRGMGIPGVVVSGVKNAGLQFVKQNKKGFNADYSEVGEALLNMSPTIGSKFSKLDAAGNSYAYNKKDILEKGFSLENSKGLEAGATTVEALTNVPIARVLRKIENIKGALDNQNEAWQRFMMGLGWSAWDVGATDYQEKNKKSKKKENKFPFAPIKY